METAEAPIPVPTAAAPSFAAQLTPTSKKRDHEGKVVQNHTPPTDPQSSQLSASGSPIMTRESTPLTELGSTPGNSPSRAATTTTPTTAASADGKKRRLTFAEREVDKAIKRREKEEKEKLKAEAKVKKDQEKKRKDDEKKLKDDEKQAARRVKEALKEEKQKQKDAVKQEKEAEKQRKEADALKKERAQMRIGNFFGRPAAASTPPASPFAMSTGTSRRSSIVSIDMGDSPANDIALAKSTNPDFDKWILPFDPQHMDIAPVNRFLGSGPKDGNLALNQDFVPEQLAVRFQKRCRAKPAIRPIRELVEQTATSTEEPTDFTKLVTSLVNVPYKYLSFCQDVRPPYCGTYTRIVSAPAARRLAINPSHRGLPQTDYDYDSEAEWQPPEEGDENLSDDDARSEDEEGAEEMDDFLDDEGETARRQQLVSDMVPKSSGLCWEGCPHPTEQTEATDATLDLSMYRMDVLHDATTFPINPYETTHWVDLGKPSPKKAPTKTLPPPDTPMQPPRAPLAAIHGNSPKLAPTSSFFVSIPKPDHNGLSDKIKPKDGAATGKPTKMISADLLPAFKEAVLGSTLTKTGLIEVLKNQFPKCSKDAIKGTLETIAKRQGTKESEKKWILTE